MDRIALPCKRKKPDGSAIAVATMQECMELTIQCDGVWSVPEGPLVSGKVSGKSGCRSKCMANGRLSREDWIAVARKALIASGVDDVKVDVLARRMKVTRGSFYWHFEHRQELLDALLEDWKANNRREIAAVERRAEEGATGLIELFKVWLAEDPNFPAFDIAIRVWARKSREVAKLVHEIDDAWIALFKRFYEHSGMAETEAFVRARIMYFHQIGYYALSISETLQDRIALAPAYYRALAGGEPPADMEEVLQALARPKPRGRRKAVA
jgi:AcrR family transcriptional regulator